MLLNCRISIFLTLLFFQITCGSSTKIPNSTPNEASLLQQPELENSQNQLPANGIMQLDDMFFTTSTKSGLISRKYHWPDKTLIYKIDPHFTPAEVKTIFGAMAEIQSKTCIRFKLRTDETIYVNIFKGGIKSGCSSFVGRIASKYQPQKLNLEGNHCIVHGIIVHELIHALGFEHEQSRSDRDSYVTINWKNIRKGYEFNFHKFGPSRISSYGIPYDYGSIMHYRSTEFSKNGEPTIESKKPNITLGQRRKLSSYDVLKLKKMYSC